MQEYVSRNEYEVTITAIRESLTRIEKQLETGAGTFQSVQVMQQRLTAEFEHLQKSVSTIDAEIEHIISGKQTSLTQRVNTMEIKLGIIEKIPGDLAVLHNQLQVLSLQFTTFVSSASKATAAAEKTAARTDSWLQTILRVLVPLILFAAGYYMGDRIPDSTPNTEKKQSGVTTDATQ